MSHMRNCTAEVTFRCKAPCTAETIQLEGMSSYDAATHCASLMAAQRMAAANGANVSSAGGTAPHPPTGYQAATSPPSDTSSGSAPTASSRDVLARSQADAAGTPPTSSVAAGGVARPGHWGAAGTVPPNRPLGSTFGGRHSGPNSQHAGAGSNGGTGSGGGSLLAAVAANALRRMQSALTSAFGAAAAAAAGAAPPPWSPAPLGGYTTTNAAEAVAAQQPLPQQALPVSAGSSLALPTSPMRVAGHAEYVMPFTSHGIGPDNSAPAPPVALHNGGDLLTAPLPTPLAQQPPATWAARSTAVGVPQPSTRLLVPPAAAGALSACPVLERPPLDRLGLGGTGSADPSIHPLLTASDSSPSHLNLAEPRPLPSVFHPALREYAVMLTAKDDASGSSSGAAVPLQHRVQPQRQRTLPLSTFRNSAGISQQHEKKEEEEEEAEATGEGSATDFEEPLMQEEVARAGRGGAAAQGGRLARCAFGGGHLQPTALAQGWVIPGPDNQHPLALPPPQETGEGTAQGVAVRSSITRSNCADTAGHEKAAAASVRRISPRLTHKMRVALRRGGTFGAAPTPPPATSLHSGSRLRRSTRPRRHSSGSGTVAAEEGNSMRTVDSGILGLPLAPSGGHCRALATATAAAVDDADLSPAASGIDSASDSLGPSRHSLGAIGMSEVSQSWSAFPESCGFEETVGAGPAVSCRPPPEAAAAVAAEQRGANDVERGEVFVSGVDGGQAAEAGRAAKQARHRSPRGGLTPPGSLTALLPPHLALTPEGGLPWQRDGTASAHSLANEDSGTGGGDSAAPIWLDSAADDMIWAPSH
jgi:hypothetical protein